MNLTRKLTLAAPATSGGTVTTTAAEFSTLVGANGLTTGVTYWIPLSPAMWFATGAATYIGVGFVSGGVTYFGDEALAAATEVDLGAGTFASRPTTGFDSGVMYYRRMTDLGNCSPIMTWLGGTSTAWTPLNGEQKVYSLMADTYHTTADGTERVATNCQFTAPANLLALDGMGLKLVFAAYKSAAAESPVMNIKFGPNGTIADSVLAGPWTAGTTNRQFAQTLSAKRASSSTLQGQGAGSVTATGHRWGNQTAGARVSAVGSLDFTVANYLSLTVQRTTPFAEYMLTDVFDVWLTGR